MNAPDVDVEDRLKIWDAMQMIYMDIDPEYELENIAKVCAESKYSVQELESILFQEVLPSCRFNLMMIPAPEWRGFEIDWLKDRVLKKHLYGRRKPIWFRHYTTLWWRKIENKIVYQRERSKKYI